MSELAAAVLIASGMATRYSPETMDQVYQNRLRWGHVQPCSECVGRVALLDCSRLGQRVWLELPTGAIIGPVLVADCAASHHAEVLQDRGFAVDLSFELAESLGVVDAPLPGVRVWSGFPLLGAGRMRWV